MARAHLVRPVLDLMGNLLSDVRVQVFNVTDGAPVTPVYLGPVATDPTPQPLAFPNGIIDFYLDKPQRVRLGVRQGIAAEVFFNDVDVLAPAESVTASDVVFTPAGTIAATNVQTALMEASGDLTLHLDDTEAAHHASAVSFTPVNSIDALNVQGALAELGIDVIRIDLKNADQDTRLTKVEQSSGVQPVVGADPETGQATMKATSFSLQTVVAGPLAVADNIVKPGLRVVKASTAHTVVARVDTVPTGAPIRIEVRRFNGGVYADSLGVVSILAGSSLGLLLGLNHACAKGDILKFKVLEVGSTVAGADINLSVDFA